MTNYAPSILSLLFLIGAATTHAFQTSQMLPMRIESIPKEEIRQRLGLKQTDPTNDNSNNNSGGGLSIGSGPNMQYSLMNEHEVVCPVSGTHQGVLCTASLQQPIEPGQYAAESIANNHELVSQAILSGSLAASIRSRSCVDGNSVYYLPYIITLVESLMADEMESIDLEGMVFNSGGLETNEILMDMTPEEEEEEGQSSVMLYACNTNVDQSSVTSDVYLLPPEKNGKVWRFNVEYKLATINLQAIASFGKRDSATPLRPDVWLKDDYY
ncbi:hypothetical protein ACHAXR_005347 [Thalassiosira sp. AJA248-18]